MILQCSECKARYLIPDTAIGTDGRMVRCANCGHTWFEKPAEILAGKEKDELDRMLEGIAPPPEAPKPIPKGSNLPAARQREPLPAGVLASMVVAALVAIALGILIIRPAWYGFPPTRGLELSDVVMIKLTGDHGPVYQITGKIANNSPQAMTLPKLRITLVDADGSVEHAPWEFTNKGKTLDPGKSSAFNSGNLEIIPGKGWRFVVEIGNPLELNLRRKPG